MSHSSKANVSVEANVRALYEKFPYPPLGDHGIASLEEPPGDFQRLHLSYRLGRWGARALPRDMSIWIAGSGAMQAAEVALLYPEAQILATDLSDASIERTRGLLDDLNIENVETRRESILDADHADRFDFILCTGVLHALEQPATGGRILSRALKSDGAAYLMLYSTAKRRLTLAMQDALAVLDSDSNFDEKQRLALEIVNAVTHEHSGCTELGDFFRESGLHTEEERIEFADRILHPCEYAYDVDELLGLLDDSNLTFFDWLYPGAWDLSNYVNHEEIRRRNQRLSVLDQARLIYALGQSKSPIFDLLVFKKGATTPRPAQDQEILTMRPIARQPSKHHIIENNAIARAETRALFTQRDGKLVRTTGRPGTPVVRVLNPRIADILERCDGTRTVAQVCAETVPSATSQQAADLFRGLLSPDLALAVPAAE